VGLAESLREHERAWNDRPLLRHIYREWFALLASRLSSVPGTTIELGSGIGQLRDAVPDLVTTDVEPTPWADRVVDAEALPFGAGELANIVMLDVYHHLPRPAPFLDEARRTLAPGGRVVMLEPYCSPFSSLAYRLHREHLDQSVDPFAEDPRLETEPMEGNMALPTLAFFRHEQAFRARWPELALVERRLMTFVLYPLSGGFSAPQVLPAFLRRPVGALERALTPLAWLLAFRALIVVERRDEGRGPPPRSDTRTGTS
jgi:SAM-dependent methyltransferase